MNDRLGILNRIFFALVAVTALMPGASAQEIDRNIRQQLTTGPKRSISSVPTPANWDRFLVFVWQYKTDAERDAELYDQLGLRAFHIDRGAGQQSRVRWAHRQQMPYYVDHAAGKGILHLTPASGLNDLSRDGTLTQRPFSLVERSTVEELCRRVDANIDVVRNGPALAIALDDEVSLAHFTSPIEVDSSPSSIQIYRSWLRQRYGSINAINRQWGTSFKGFAQIKPVTYEYVRAGLSATQMSEWNIGRWMDWRSYMDSQYAALLSRITAYTSRKVPGIPVGIVGGQQPGPYGGYDYDKLRDSLQWIEAYDIGGTNEILRSFWRNPRRGIVQTFFASGDQRRDEWFLWYYWAHGNHGVIAWPSLAGNQPWFENGKAHSKITRLASAFREIQHPKLSMLRHDDARLVTDPVALVYSHSSIQASWACDATAHGKTWPRRSSSLDNSSSSSGKNRVGWNKLLEDCGIQAVWISDREIVAGTLREDRFRAVILPRALAVSDAVCESIREFAEQGGHVIADYWAAVLDEHGRGRERGGLDGLFGIRRSESAGQFDGTTLAEVNGELYQKPFLDRLPQRSLKHLGITAVERGTTAIDSAQGIRVSKADVVVRRRGDLNATYLNLSPVAYFDNQFRQSQAGESLRNLLKLILSEAGIKPRVRIQRNERDMPMVESLIWRLNGKEYLVIVGNPSRQASVNAAGHMDFGLDAGEVTVSLSESVRNVRDVRSNKIIPADTTFKISWRPWEATVLELNN